MFPIPDVAMTPALVAVSLRAARDGFAAGAAGGPSAGGVGPAAKPVERACWNNGYLSGARAATYLDPDIEHTQQRAVFEWICVAREVEPRLGLAYAIPNGGGRSKAEAGRLRAEGVLAGAPDICLPFSGAESSALYIEMKSRDGRLSKEQRALHPELRAVGNRVEVCHSWADAVDAMINHLGGLQ